MIRLVRREHNRCRHAHRLTVARSLDHQRTTAVALVPAQHHQLLTGEQIGHAHRLDRDDARRRRHDVQIHQRWRPQLAREVADSLLDIAVWRHEIGRTMTILRHPFEQVRIHICADPDREDTRSA